MLSFSVFHTHQIHNSWTIPSSLSMLNVTLILETASSACIILVALVGWPSHTSWVLPRYRARNNTPSIRTLGSVTGPGNKTVYSYSLLSNTGTSNTNVGIGQGEKRHIYKGAQRQQGTPILTTLKIERYLKDTKKHCTRDRDREGPAMRQLNVRKWNSKSPETA